MSGSLKIKLILVAIVAVVLLFNYEAVFNTRPSLEYSYDEKLIFITALSMGVIFANALYNLTLFLYLRSLEHLFYSAAQIATLLFLISLDSVNIAPFDEIFRLKSYLLIDISQIFLLIFSLLFIKEFSKSYISKELFLLIDTILVIAFFDLVLALIFKKGILIRIVPVFITVWLVLSEFYRLNSKRDIPFFALMIGWGAVIFITVVEYLGFIELSGVAFPYLHIALAIDSLMLSFAISYKFKLNEDRRRVERSILFQKNRLSSMGEMISAITHQWRQPLNYLSFALMGIKRECKESKRALELIESSSAKLQYMSQTLESFREFYNPTKTKELFLAFEAVESAVKISAIDEISIDVERDFKIYGKKNELEQVILNLLNNAKEACKERDLDMEIVIKEREIRIKDSCGGVSESMKEDIFKPYITTKEGRDGIGLYISKLIINESFKGEIYFKNVDNGAEFVINLPKNDLREEHND
jgi:signal transduction histidine kinase